MEKTCLVTKFKADTNNNNLPFLDWYKVYFKSVSNPTDKTQGLRGVMSSEKNIKVLGNIHFTDSTLTQDLGTEILANKSEFYVSNGDGVLLIPKNATQIISVAGATNAAKAYYIKLDEYEDSETLTEVSVRRSESEGDIISLAKNINIRTIVVSECPNVKGDIIDFIIKQIDIYGRTSGTLNIEKYSSAVTIGQITGYSNYTINFVSASEFNYITNEVTTTYKKIDGAWVRQA